MSLNYFGRRLAHSVIVLIAVLLVVFAVTHVLGDPVSIALPPQAPQAQIDALRERLGLNEPILVQLKDFLLDAASGSFGESFWQRRPALGLVIGRIPATIYLALVAFALVVPLGVGMGIVAALRPNSFVSRVVNLLSFLGISIVDFWLALMLILVFAVNLRLLPTSGFGEVDHVILPALTLALLSWGTLAQVTRASVTEELSKPYVAAARARGVSERRVVWRHALRNGLIPIVTVCGGLLIGLLGGAVIAETVFGWPGIGLILVQAIGKRDLPLIEAAVFVTALVVIVVNLGVDLLYGVINPKVRLS